VGAGNNGRGVPAHQPLAAGLILSAGLLVAIGGAVGVTLATVQLVATIAVVRRPGQPGPLAAAGLTLAVAPVGAVIHWLAQSPVGCPCQRVAHAPGLVSLTGLVVLTDLCLLGLAVWAAHPARGTGWAS
jgi:hypothetical protein